MGCNVRIEMHLDGSPITAHGRVVREAAGGAKGVELDAITESDRERSCAS